MISKKSKIYVAGSNGMVGSAIVRALKIKGYNNLIVSSSKNLDLTDQNKTFKFLKKRNLNLYLLHPPKWVAFQIII